MRPFAAVFDRLGNPLEPETLESLDRALRGSTGPRRTAVELPDSATGFWTGSTASIREAPESGEFAFPEVGAHCLGAEDLDVTRLSKSLGLAPSGSVADLLVLGLAKLGDEVWPLIREDFSLALVDRRRNALFLARSPFAGRALFFLEAGDVVIAADEIEVLLRWGGCARSLDANQLARFFGLEEPGFGRTYFQGIREVAPGSVVEFSPERRREGRFWKIEPHRKSRLGADEAFAESFLHLLESETAKFLHDVDRLGVMLSGGIDSTSIAVLAGREAERTAGSVAACSWVFDEFASCDERAGIESTLAGHAFEVIQVNGDRCWPLVDLELFSTQPGTPEENPYRALKRSLYSAAGDRGRTILLNGGFADILYRGGSLYFRDLVREGRWMTALRALGRQLGSSGWRSAAGSAARLLRATGRRAAQRPAPPWLTSAAERRWSEELGATPPAARDARDVLPYLAMEARGLAIENRYAREQRVEIASPYWSQEWVDFMVSLPAHQVYRPGTTKYIARQAMRGVIPEAVRVRQQPTLLDPLFDRGVFERESGLVEDLLHGGKTIWQEFVDPAFIKKVGPSSPPKSKVVLWQCLSLELWRRKHGWELS